MATDDHHTIQEFRASVGAQWPFLSDPSARSSGTSNIQEYTDHERYSTLNAVSGGRDGTQVIPGVRELHDGEEAASAKRRAGAPVGSDR